MRKSCPPLPTQTRIAQFLDEKTALIDKAIAQKQRLIELLEERRQILIHQAVTRGLDPNVELRDSGVDWIGKVPKHWEVKKLKSVSSYFKGNAFSSSIFRDEGLPIVKATNLNDGVISKVNTFLRPEDTAEFTRFRLQPGDIIMTSVGSRPEMLKSAVGQVCQVQQDIEESYLNQNLIAFAPGDEVESDYLYSTLSSSVYRQALAEISQWIANQAYLQVDDVRSIFLPMPPADEQKSIMQALVNLTAKSRSAISRLEETIRTLKEYKSTLINSAVTGQIEV